MKRAFATLLVVVLGLFAAAGCNSTYSRLEVQSEGTDVYTRFDGRRALEIGVGFSGRFRAMDTGDDARAFDLRSADDSVLEIAPVLKDPDELDADERAEAGIVFAFLPRRRGTTDVEVVVDGRVAERIPVTIGSQR